MNTFRQGMKHWRRLHTANITVINVPRSSINKQKTLSVTVHF